MRSARQAAPGRFETLPTAWSSIVPFPNPLEWEPFRSRPVGVKRQSTVVVRPNRGDERMRKFLECRAALTSDPESRITGPGLAYLREGHRSRGAPMSHVRCGKC